MKYIQFIIESNSNKKLDAFTKECINAIRRSGAVKAGPIPFKGKRLFYCYSPNGKTIDRLMVLKCPKGVSVTINSLENPQ
jgi:ribosomal protein S10